jgi:hypothetical protein
VCVCVCIAEKRTGKLAATSGKPFR